MTVQVAKGTGLGCVQRPGLGLCTSCASGQGTGLGAVYKRPEMPGCGCVHVASTGLELFRDRLDLKYVQVAEAPA